MKSILVCFLLLIAPCTQAQLTKKVDPTEATRLQAGELVRYFKTRPTQIEKGLPYQVLIVVRADSMIVKTNNWVYSMALNEKQREDLQSGLGGLNYKTLNLHPHEKGTPEDERERLYMYLSARQGKKVIRWNNKTHDARGQTLLIETLEVYHYFAREEKEKGDYRPCLDPTLHPNDSGHIQLLRSKASAEGNPAWNGRIDFDRDLGNRQGRPVDRRFVRRCDGGHHEKRSLLVFETIQRGGLSRELREESFHSVSVHWRVIPSVDRGLVFEPGIDRQLLATIEGAVFDFHAPWSRF